MEWLSPKLEEIYICENCQSQELEKYTWGFKRTPAHEFQLWNPFQNHRYEYEVWIWNKFGLPPMHFKTGTIPKILNLNGIMQLDFLMAIIWKGKLVEMELFDFWVFADNRRIFSYSPFWKFFSRYKGFILYFSSPLSQMGRGKCWLEAENLFSCEAFISPSESPKSSQKAASFQADVEARYRRLKMGVPAKKGVWIWQVGLELQWRIGTRINLKGVPQNWGMHDAY